MRHKWILFAIPLLLLLGAVIPMLPVLFPRPSKATLANFSRITIGMTRQEVEDILGGPSGDHRTGPTENARFRKLGTLTPGYEFWWGDEGFIAISFIAGSDGTPDLVEKKVTKPEAKVDLPLHRLATWRLVRWADQKPKP